MDIITYGEWGVFVLVVFKWCENSTTVLLLIAYSILYSLLYLQTEKGRKQWNCLE